MCIGGLRLSFLWIFRTSEGRLIENQTLAATRDALLPQLMSGKLRVRDAEKAVEAVVWVPEHPPASFPHHRAIADPNVRKRPITQKTAVVTPPVLKQPVYRAWNA